MEIETTLPMPVIVYMQCKACSAVWKCEGTRSDMALIISNLACPECNATGTKMNDWQYDSKKILED